MSRNRTSSFVLGLASIVGMTIVATWGAENSNPAAASAFNAELQFILTDGFRSTTPLDQVKSRVNRARTLNSKDPSVDYSFGLIQMKRQQLEPAAESFHAALKVDPTYLPAQQALVRLRLVRMRLVKSDLKVLLSELNDFATVVGSSTMKWRDEQQRSEAAMFLGRVVGYLSKPEMKLVDRSQLQTAEAGIEKSLGSSYVDAYFAGMEQLTHDYDALKAAFEEKTAQKSEQDSKKATEKATELRKKSSEADKKQESLRISKDEKKAKFEERMKQIDKSLEDIEKQYDKLFASGERYQELIEKTRLDLARAQTELDFRGPNNAQNRAQPSVILLQEELVRYQEEFAELEERADELLSTGRQLVQERINAANDFEKETGELTRNSEALDKWNKSMKKNAEKLQNSKQKKSPVNIAELKSRLSRPDSYFRIDYLAEVDRLMKEHGITPKADKKTAKEKSVKEKTAKVGS